MKPFKSLVLALCFTLTWPAFAAPLFPDVPDNHWAKDAVAALAAKGLVEGYPDGTFKGDRSASRWEVAMIVARLLAKMEQAHATFATKAELDELRKLVNALREELDALGVRVDKLEENVASLDKRVTELERITFYGYLDSRAAFQSFQNNGRSTMQSLWYPGITTINYNSIVGTAGGAGGITRPYTNTGASGAILPPGQSAVVPTFNPFTTGVLGLTNWQTGRPLTSGTGFTAKAILGVNIRVSDDFDAGVEFAAYSSQGDQIVDAYYGVQQPYLSNPFTRQSGFASGANQGLGNAPYTRMNLDRFWVRHNPTGTKLTVGAFSDQDFNDSVFAGFVNPNAFGPERLENYGFLVDGSLSLNEDATTKLSWQVMGSALPDGNAGVIIPNIPGAGQDYFGYNLGVKLGLSWNDDAGHVNFNFLRTAEDASNGGSLLTGLHQSANLQLGWVNPPGYYINQMVNPATRSGMGTPGDKRPIPMGAAYGNDGSLAFPVGALLLPQGVPNLGGVGPQGQTTYGLAADYTFDYSWSPRIFGEYAHSDYRPNKNSGYSATGDAWKVGLGATLLNGDLDLQAHFLSVDPTFDPFVIEMPQVGGISTPLWHTPDFNFMNTQYSLHNTAELPHNREGFKLKGTWKFLPTGRIMVEYGSLTQKQSSMQDIRYSTGSLGLGSPNTDVLGYSPGFIDALFKGYHPATFAAAGGNRLAVPLEDPKGRVTNLYVSGGYKWLFDQENNNRGVTLSGGVKTLAFDRSSNMSVIGVANGVPLGTAIQAENQNRVDLGFTGWHVGVDYDLTETFKVNAGYTSIDIKGHLDPFNVYGAYAAAAGTAKFDDIDITQTWPELGFSWDIGSDLTWSANGRYYDFKDHIPAYVFAVPQVPGVNINNGPQGAHPFSWKGLQITTQLSLKF